VVATMRRGPPSAVPCPAGEAQAEKSRSKAIHN
jgi:hypothetical protein